MPTVYHDSDHASSTTTSAVEQGALVIRNKDNQKQDINKLSRDTENAHKTLEQIFDKQKQLDTIETIDLINDIASQVKTISAKQDRIKAQNELASEKEKILANAKKEYENLTEEQKKAYGSPDNYAANIYYEKVNEQVKQNVKNGHNIGGMGSSFDKGVDTATAIVTGILTGDITGGLAGGSAPWLAGEIKKQTGHYDAKNERWETDDPQANLIAHAILGAAVAQLQGNSALAGATGAVTGEIAANKIREQLYNNRDSANLSEDEKKQISALSQLASGIAIALASGGDVGDAGTAVASSKNAVENNGLAKLALEGCAIAAPCRSAVAKKVLEYGVKAGITTIVAKQIADNISSEDLDHLITLNMMGNDEITNRYLGYLSDKYATTIAIEPNERPKLEGYPIPENNDVPPLITPIPEQDKDAGKLVTPIIEQDKNAGILAGPEIEIGDWRDFILTNQDKSFVDYKGDLNKGDQIDLTKFTARQKVSGGKANYVDPKTGWILSPDRAGANSHGGSAWKLTDKKGNRIATLDENGNVLRK